MVLLCFWTENKRNGKMMSKVLLTGSSGFIGGYIVEELLAQDHKVVGVDNFSKYGHITKSYDSNPNYKLIEGDVTDPGLLEELLMDCDHFIAGAALIGGISYFHTYAYDLLAKNERITAASVDAAINAHKHGKLKKVTYMSSSMVFESTDRWPSKEGDERLVPPPLSSYGFQKLAVEYFAKAAWDQYNLPYTIVRPFNCVGIGESRALGNVDIKSGNVTLAMSHVVPDLVQKIIRGQNPLNILGEGNQIRHYTYGGDLARGIVATLNAEIALNNDFNISTAKGHTVIELATEINRIINGPESKLTFHYETAFEHDVQKRIPDVKKAKELLGFEATTSLEDMLEEVIPWIRDAIKNGSI